jgi:hypothetical protein
MPKSLVVLTADKSMRLCVEAILARARELDLCLASDDYQVLADGHCDPGVFRMGHESLRSQLKQYRFAILMCDRVGAGAGTMTREGMEAQMEGRLGQNGWQGRSAAIVIEPELENWIWTDSTDLDSLLGWQGRQPALREWLRLEGYLHAGQLKPLEPKECLDKALRLVGGKRDGALFQKIASRVNLGRCTDPAFTKLLATLRTWFPLQQAD